MCTVFEIIVLIFKSCQCCKCKDSILLRRNQNTLHLLMKNQYFKTLSKHMCQSINYFAYKVCMQKHTKSIAA